MIEENVRSLMDSGREGEREREWMKKIELNWKPGPRNESWPKLIPDWIQIMTRKKKKRRRKHWKGFAADFSDPSHNQGIAEAVGWPCGFFERAFPSIFFHSFLSFLNNSNKTDRLDNRKKILVLKLVGFDLQISGFGRDCSANSATNPAHLWLFLVSAPRSSLEILGQWVGISYRWRHWSRMKCKTVLIIREKNV